MTAQTEAPASGAAGRTAVRAAAGASRHPGGARAEVRDDFTRRLVSMSFLVRLLALLAGLAVLVGADVPLTVVGAALLLGATSYLGVSRRSRLVDLFVRHPIFVLVDVILVLVVTWVAGPDSPLVLATLSTAFVAGLLVPTRALVIIVVALAGGFTGVWGSVRQEQQFGFFVVVGVPLLYVLLAWIGSAVRRVHREQVEALSALAASRTATAAAEERARLAREMHDSLAKTLHGVAMGAAALPRWVETDPTRAVREAHLLADGAERAADEARALLKRMRADQPDRPLAEILGALCRDWSAAQGVLCEFTAVGVVDVSSHVRYELVAITGECLENVARHAEATHVLVSLSRSGEGIELMVSDDGKGITVDLDEAARGGHYGVLGMVERAREAGGELTLLAGPGGGTVVQVRLPLEVMSV
jgi:signal transduction histidine kinase